MVFLLTANYSEGILDIKGCRGLALLRFQKLHILRTLFIIPRHDGIQNRCIMSNRVCSRSQCKLLSRKRFTMRGARGCRLSVIIWLWQFNAKSIDFKRPPTRNKLSLNIGSRTIICEHLWIVLCFCKISIS